MKKIVMAGFCVHVLAFSQVSTGIRPSTTVEAARNYTKPASAEVSRPLLGYLLNNSNLLYSVVGSVAHASWGEPLVMPESTDVAYLPPRQEYVMSSSPNGVSVGRLSRSAIEPGPSIAGLVACPDGVAFSPSGTAAAMWFAARRRIQVLTGLPSEVHISFSVELAAGSELRSFAVPDDGRLVIVSYGSQPGMSISTDGEPWQTLPANFAPDAWTFLPDSHDLALSDRVRHALMILQSVDHAVPVERVLKQGDIDADMVAVNKEGSMLLAAKAGTSVVWSADLRTGAVSTRPIPDKTYSLTLLRDGHTFLVSLRDAPIVVATLDIQAQTN